MHLTDTQVLQVLSTLIGFDTTSRNSNLPLIDWAEVRLRQSGFVTRRIPSPDGTKANLLASVGPRDVPGYILSGHTDVVPVDGQSWSGNPFELRIAGGRAFGRGACDMKGFLAVCIGLAPEMAAATLRRPLHIALSYDEEVGCLGAQQLCAQLRDTGFRADGCFVGEPTGMNVVIGHKNKRNVRVTVRGRSCHSSLAPNGVNAVQWGARLAAKVHDIADALARDGARDELYDVPHSTAHVGVFRGGSALNTVPDVAELLFELRTLPCDDADDLIRRIERHAREKLEPEMQAIDADAGFIFDVYASTPGLEMAPDAPIVMLAQRLISKEGHSKVAFMTEAGIFQRVAGIPAVVIGPGSIDDAHKPDESIEISKLHRCASFVRRLVDHCCSDPG